MKYSSRTSVCIFSIAFIFFSMAATAQTQSGKTDASFILQLDSLFWKGYNTCDTSLCSKYLASDVAFYHDKGGPTLGKENLLASIQNNLCSNSTSYKLRREAIKETVRVFPLQKGGVLYGAVLSGGHFFYLSQNGQPEHLDGRARFTHLWLLQNGEWKMTNILSYDHGPAVKSAKAKSKTIKK